MSNESGPPFRADHVGSLLRPKALLAAREEHQKDWITAATLRECEDDCIKKAVQMQAELGLKGVTDGEFRRGSWHMDFLYQIGGVEKTDRVLHIAFKNQAGTIEFSPAAHRVAGKLTLEKTVFGEDFAYLKSVAPPGTTPKLTIPSPSMLHYRGGRAAIDEAAYPEMDSFWHDLAEVYRQELAGLAALGRLRAVALCAEGAEEGRARPRHHQAAGARGQGPAEAPHRRGVEVRAPRTAVPQPAMRLLLHRRGQRADHRGGEGQAPPRRRGRSRGLGRHLTLSCRRAGGAKRNPPFSCGIDGWRVPLRFTRPTALRIAG